MFLRSSINFLLAASAIALTPLSALASCVYERQTEVGNELKIPVHAWVNSDQSATPKGIVVAIHGLVFTGAAYDSFARYLSDSGYLVYAQDLRGFGAWKSEDGKFGTDRAIHFTQSKDDLTALLKYLRAHHPGIPIYCLGESIGANYALWEAQTHPELMDGAILCSISYKVDVHPRAIWPLTFVQGLAHPKSPLNLKPYLKPILSEDRQLTEKCLSIPETCTAMSPEDLIKAAVTNRRTVQHIDQIPESMPILVVAGKKDKIQKTRTLAHMVSRMGSKNTQLVVLPDRGHLLVEHQPVNDKVSTVLTSWLEEQVQAHLRATKPKSGHETSPDPTVSYLKRSQR
ncbi:MAG: lysophospholipase [Candidatus Obscuribacterales bacterium]|nr:lysophospholipase [Candidatus Obscuribacterales bacterium]